MSLSTSTLGIFLTAALTVSARPYSPGGYPPQSSSYGSSASWNLKNFKSLVAFGDSYTDDSRLAYFYDHNGAAPPVGWVDPVNYAAADGGRIWAEYVKQYTGCNLYNYAVQGAVCSNDITPRIFGLINEDFPAVAQYEVPAYIADSKYYANGTKFLDIPCDETVYSMWIGTNDLGVDAFITDSQVKGTNLVTYLDCVYNSLDAIYENGGRYFVLQNVAPLQLTPLYGLPDAGGVTGNNSLYWSDKPSNLTEISDRMLEQVVTVNAIYKDRTPLAVEIVRRYPGAHIAVMDMYSLFYDIYNNPSEYLNGTAPLNVTGYINHCDEAGGDCVQQASPDSYMWYDQLHPSEQTSRVIAAHFVDVVRGNSSYAQYWS